MATFANYVSGLLAPIITNISGVLAKVNDFHNTLTQMQTVHPVSIVNSTLRVNGMLGTQFSATIIEENVLLAITLPTNTETWVGTLILTVSTDAQLVADTNVIFVNPPNMLSGSIFKCDLVYSSGTVYVLFEKLK